MSLNIIKKEISLNVGQPNNLEIIHAMQGDNKSIEITATLYNLNELYTINTDIIKIKGVNPLGGNIYKAASSHTTHTVTFTLTDDMLISDGLLRLVIVLTENNKQLTTFPFVIRVIGSPGDTTMEDAKTVSALVEEAEKWALLSQSYAVGTDNKVRDGDANDNADYYYKQIKSLMSSTGTGNGNGNILYYETYEEFKTDLDAGNIPNETLVCIKETTVNNGSDDNPDNPDNPAPDKKAKLLLFHKSGMKWISDDMENWADLYGDENFELCVSPYNDDYADIGYQLVCCEDMLFCTNGSNIYYSQHNIWDEENTDNIWKPVNFFLYGGSFNSCYMAYGNKKLMIIYNNIGYVIDYDTIKEKRAEGISKSDFTIMPELDGDNVIVNNLKYGNGIFVVMVTRTKEGNSNKEGCSWYTTDCISWNYLGSIVADIGSGGNFYTRLVYGNGVFIVTQISISMVDTHMFKILNTNNLNAGWMTVNGIILSRKYNIDTNNEFITFSDIVFDAKTNKFIVPYSLKDSSYASGFYVFDSALNWNNVTDDDILNGLNWSIIKINDVVKLYNCICYDGRLYGFIDGTNWSMVDDLETYHYTDYGTITTGNPNHASVSFSLLNTHFTQYALVDKPLWDIDNEIVENINAFDADGII